MNSSRDLIASKMIRPLVPLINFQKFLLLDQCQGICDIYNPLSWCAIAIYFKFEDKDILFQERE